MKSFLIMSLRWSSQQHTNNNSFVCVCVCVWAWVRERKGRVSEHSMGRERRSGSNWILWSRIRGASESSSSPFIDWLGAEKKWRLVKGEVCAANTLNRWKEGREVYTVDGADALKFMYSVWCRRLKACPPTVSPYCIALLPLLSHTIMQIFNVLYCCLGCC